jgi:transcriptional regulator NrdR family protein
MTDPIETTLQACPVCPHCGYKHKDVLEWSFGPGLDGVSSRRECDHCAGTFDCERVMDISYTTNIWIEGRE